ncbi:MAG: CDP-alcohol phosphatidyltransferase family protein [Eubacteriales bacterium]|nr:CDP-alcohol phosphatidyltransferase family protein [Eubacteriales bacterium]
MLGFYNYTVVLTYVGLGISIVGMTRAMEGDFRWAVLCLAIAGLCDLFDGKIARTKEDRTKEEKSFGIQIDSLCDVVCFGAFPIILCYCLGVRGTLGVGILALYGMASVIRLGYFNVMEEKRQGETEECRQCFQGLPITSMSLILPVLYLARGLCGSLFLVVVRLAMLLSGILFVSDIRVLKFQRPWRVLFLAVTAIGLALAFRLL